MMGVVLLIGIIIIVLLDQIANNQATRNGQGTGSGVPVAPTKWSDPFVLRFVGILLVVGIGFLAWSRMVAVHP